VNDSEEKRNRFQLFMYRTTVATRPPLPSATSDRTPGHLDLPMTDGNTAIVRLLYLVLSIALRSWKLASTDRE